VPDRIDVAPTTAPASQIRERLAERLERVTDLLMALLIPLRDLEAAGARLARLDRVLQGVNLFEVAWVRRIDQGAD
jgi:hypothetical protein